MSLGGFSSSVGRAQGWKLWGRWFESNLKHLFSNFRLFITYILLGINNYQYINNKAQREKTSSLLIQNKDLIYLSLHLKMSSAFSQTQLCEIFAYELPSGVLKTKTLSRNSVNLINDTHSKPIIVYNFHSFLSKNRIFLFVNNTLNFTKSAYTSSNQTVNSIAELFFAANWLERECSELSGVCFAGKKDLRNLMLQYGDLSNPFRKLVPTIGFKEFLYDVSRDTVIQQEISNAVKHNDNYLYV